MMMIMVIMVMVVVVMMSFFCLKVSATFDPHCEEWGIETIYQVPSLGSRKAFDFSSECLFKCLE